MMNESVGIDGISLSTPLEADDALVEVAPTKSKKWARSTNYSTKEDTALVMAWDSVALIL